MSAEADVIVELVGPGDFLERLEKHSPKHTRAKAGKTIGWVPRLSMNDPSWDFGGRRAAIFLVG